MRMTVVARPSAGDVVIQLTQASDTIMMEPEAALQLAEAIRNSVLYITDTTRMARN